MTINFAPCDGKTEDHWDFREGDIDGELYIHKETISFFMEISSRGIPYMDDGERIHLELSAADARRMAEILILLATKLENSNADSSLSPA